MRIQKKRRKQGKTDYKLRLRLLKSDIPRIVIRKTNRYIIVQLVESNEARDKVISGVTSKDLLKQGWNEKFSGSLKSTPAGYLTGLLMAKKIKDEGKVILDLGMQKTIKGNKIYAVVKGLVDGGVNLNTGEGIFPSEERLNGEHLKPELKSIIKSVMEKLK